MSAVDFSSFEGSKENILPLVRGRNPHTLVKLFGSENKSDDEVKKEKVETANAFECRLAADPMEEDRLAVWNEYIQWAVQNYPSGGKSSPIVSLYERCTNQLMGQQYKDDALYVKLWLEYTTIIPDPVCVFKFMSYNRIGAQSALMYVTWGSCLEAAGQSNDVYEVITLANKRGAQPADLLSTYYEGFVRRNFGQSANPASVEDEENSIRSPLSYVNATSLSAGSIHPNHQSGSVYWRANASHTLTTTPTPDVRPIPASAAVKPPQQGRKGLSPIPVYSNDDPIHLNDDDDDSFRWLMLPPLAKRRKENTQTPSVWTNHRVQQSQQYRVYNRKQRPMFVYYDVDIRH
jgi:hypothetical protein